MILLATWTIYCVHWGRTLSTGGKIYVEWLEPKFDITEILYTRLLVSVTENDIDIDNLCL